MFYLGFSCDDAAAVARGAMNLGTFCLLNAFGYTEDVWPKVVVARLKYPKGEDQDCFNFERFRKRLIFDFEARTATEQYGGRRTGPDGHSRHTTAAVGFERLIVEAFGGDCESRLEIPGVPIVGRRKVIRFDVSASVSVLRLIAARLICLSESGRSSALPPAPAGGVKAKYEFIMPTSNGL